MHLSEQRSSRNSSPLWGRRHLGTARSRLSIGAVFDGNGRPRDETSESGEGRGRLASTPSEIPARGWRDILLRVYQNISKHRGVALAALAA
jgi:membrane protein